MSEFEKKKTVGLSLQYRPFDPQQVGIADDVPDSFQVTVTRSDNFGISEVDVMTALELVLDEMKMKRKAVRAAACN